MGRDLCWEVVVYDSNIYSSNGAPLQFDLASGTRRAPRTAIGNGCFAPRQSTSFWGDLELVHAGGTNNHFRLEGQVKGGPMAMSAVIPLIGFKQSPLPLLVGSPLCHLQLDPTGMIALGAYTLDLMGNAAWQGTGALGQAPDGPALAGTTLYAQFAALSSDWMDTNIYMTNGVKFQLPLYWNKGGPGVTRISAPGTRATTGTVTTQQGLVIGVGP